MSLEEDLLLYNPWWQNRNIQFGLFSRKILPSLYGYLPLKQNLVITGIRRAGKTSILKLLIEKLLESTDPKNILFFSFDDETKDNRYLENVIEEYLRRIKPEGQINIFLDEIQYIKGWEWVVKKYYDYKNFRFFITGSSSLSFPKGGKALVGRTFDFVLRPLSLSEITSSTIPFEKLVKEPMEDLSNLFFINKNELRNLAQSYLSTGGFPETRRMNDEQRNKYVEESVIDKIIFKDISETFQASNPMKIKEMFDVVRSRPGLMIDISNLSQELDLSRITVSNYFSYLRMAFLVRRLSNYAGSELKIIKKNRRYYPNDNSMIYSKQSLNPLLEDLAVETACVLASDSSFYWRDKNKHEVDIVKLFKGKPYPIEVKNTSSVDNSDISGLFAFANKFAIKEAMVVTKDFLGEEMRNYYGVTLKVRFIPFWMFLLQ